MGNFEKLSVVVIVVIIVMILVVALHTWTEWPDAAPEPTEAAGIEGFSTPEPILPPGPDLSSATPANGGTPGGGLVDPFVLPPIDPPAPAPAPVVAKPRTYTIQSGDTLGGIAERELASVRHVQAIRDLNPTLGEQLRVGDTILLPDPSTLGKEALAEAKVDLPSDARPGGNYTTRKGDTWDRISRLVYKTKDKWPLIFAMNSHLHESAHSPLPEGIQLRLPK